MWTEVAKVPSKDGHSDEASPGGGALSRGAQVIRRGGLVAFPTETVYGLGADAMNAAACKKIYEAKGRPSDNPLIVHIADTEQLSAITAEVPPEGLLLANAFWPGPLTVIFRKNERIPDAVTGGLDTVAVRMPDHPVALGLIAASRRPIAAPSANRSGRPSPTRFSHVKEDMDGRVDLIIDGGDCGIGLESTILDLTCQPPAILRPGAVTKEQIEDVIGDVVFAGPVADADAPKAPGMKYRHYAPQGELFIVDGPTERVIERINHFVAEQEGNGRTVGVIATEENASRYECRHISVVGSRGDEEEIGRRLYDVLRGFDTVGADLIYSESLKTPKLGDAIMNRLLKAADGRVITVTAKRDPSPFSKKNIRRVIFASGNGIMRAPMAAALFERIYNGPELEIYCRGILVQFSEPLNQKTQAVMISNGITWENFRSEGLKDEEITSGTVILTMEERERRRIIEKFSRATEENTFVLSQFVGDELEIINPYGGTLATYGICFEVIKTSIEKLCAIIKEETAD